jgi:HlyD family secretion protein
MGNKPLFVLAAVGVLMGVLGAWYFGIRQPPQAPAFEPSANPYAHGIYANGMIETAQAAGVDINIYPEVAGTVLKVDVVDGQDVKAGAALFELDPKVQAATVAQLKAQAESAKAALTALEHQPRPESLEVALAGWHAAEAALKQAQDQYDKRRLSVDIDRRSLSADVVDTSENALRIAETNVEVARRQYELIKAGAWGYDIDTQRKLFEAAEGQSEAANALLSKYIVRASVDGRVIAVNTASGAYVSSVGTYNSYTQASVPPVVMSRGEPYLGVRAFVDEVLLPRLPKGADMVAEMQIRGSTTKVPLEFVRIQPYVMPKIELSDARTEQIDLRVLPVVFRFKPPAGSTLYPGQQVDVYIGSK